MVGVVLSLFTVPQALFCNEGEIIHGDERVFGSPIDHFSRGIPTHG